MMKEESTTTYEAFGSTAAQAAAGAPNAQVGPASPSLEAWIGDAMNKKPIRTPPPIGSSPDQVRAHYSANGPANAANPSAPVSVEPQAVELPSLSMHTHGAYSGSDNTATMGAADYQNSVVPTFNSSAQGVGVNLPSGFVAYPFKELYIHPFKGKHLSKLARAAQEKSPRIMAEVISSVLEVPGTQIAGLAFRLTLPDYYWLLYFQRKSCYTKVSFDHTTRCKSHKHIQEVIDGKKDPSTLIIRSKIDTSKLETKSYVPIETPEVLEGLGLHLPTVGSFVLTVEDPRFGDPDFDYLAKLACMIRPDLPWNERVEMVGELSAEQIEALIQYEVSCQEYGVTEKAVVTCKECGASTETILSIDASSFLPAARSKERDGS